MFLSSSSRNKVNRRPWNKRLTWLQLAFVHFYWWFTSKMQLNVRLENSLSLPFTARFPLNTFKSNSLITSYSNRLLFRKQNQQSSLITKSKSELLSLKRKIALVWSKSERLHRIKHCLINRKHKSSILKQFLLANGQQSIDVVLTLRIWMTSHLKVIFVKQIKLKFKSGASWGLVIYQWVTLIGQLLEFNVISIQEAIFGFVSLLQPHLCYTRVTRVRQSTNLLIVI